MFGPHHYVPVLKVKQGEKAALLAVASSLQQRITPLLEIVKRKPDKAPTVEKHLDTAFKRLGASVQDYPRCFLDARAITPDGPSAAAQAFQRASSEGIAYVPVTGVTRLVDVEAALAHRDRGLALRLTREEFESGELNDKLGEFIDAHNLVPEETDLVVDLGSVDDLVPAGVEALAAGFLAEVPNQERWRTLTMSACAFPLGMGGVERHSHALVERADWVAWRDGLHGCRQSVARLPSYSDGCIQHPRGVEDFDFRTMQVSASIRYAASDAWLLIKGESTRIAPPGEQFPQLATRLVYGTYRERFSGEDHCEGCRGMKAAADGRPRLGSAAVWRRLGTIHHITSVVEALAGLPWP